MVDWINLLKEPKLKSPSLVSGLPGIAYIGKLTVDYLIKELKAEPFGEVYSRYFPPYVLVREDGVVELMRNELYFWKAVESENDLILFTGNTQAVTPEGQYIIADEVLDVCLGFGVKRVYCIAGYLTGRPVERPRVYGAATDRSILEELRMHGVLPMKEGSVGGVNGLLFGLAKTKGLEGICLLGETPGYTTASGHQLVDAKAVQAVLGVITKVLGIEVDIAPLEERIRQTEEFIERLELVRRRMEEEAKETSSEAETRYII